MDSQVPGPIHLMACAADGSHPPQIFRMRLDQPLRRFAKAYGIFRQLSSEEEAELRLWTSSHGELELSNTANIYGLVDGDEVVFSRQPVAGSSSSSKIEPNQAEVVKEETSALVQVSIEEKKDPMDAPEKETKVDPSPARPPAELLALVATPQGRRKREPQATTTTAGRKKGESPKKTKDPSKTAAKAAPKKTGKKKEKDSKPKTESNSGSHQAKATVGFQRSTAIKAGPAKGWQVTAWTEERAQTDTSNRRTTVCWRATSPGRSRSFDVSGVRKPAWELQENTSSEVYAQIVGDVRPKLFQRLNACRKAVEKPLMSPTKLTRRVEAEQVSSSGAKVRRTNRKQVDVVVAAATPKRRAAASALSSCQATQLFLPGEVFVSPATTPWTCQCLAHLRRHPRCVPAEQDQPTLVHLRDYMLIGRNETSDIVINSRRSPNMISRCHAVINRQETGFAIFDQGSMNGILVNDEKVSSSRSLNSGDIITFGVPQQHPEFDYIFETRPADEEAEDAW
jgi:hypothetical protein